MFLDLLGIRNRLLISLLNPSLYQGVDFGTVSCLCSCSSRRPLFLDCLDYLICKLSRALEFQTNETCQILPHVTDDYHLRYDRQVLYDFVFYENWGDILATCSHNELFKPASDIQYSSLVDSTLVARMYKSLFIDSFAVLYLVLIVSHKATAAYIANNVPLIQTYPLPSLSWPSIHVSNPGDWIPASLR